MSIDNHRVIDTADGIAISDYTRSMRMVIMLVAVLAVSVLIFKAYYSGSGAGSMDNAGPAQFDPVGKAGGVDSLVQDASEAQRRAIEQQLQQ